MQGMAKSISGSKKDQNIKLNSGDQVKRVLICRPNGRLGNLLLITPLVQEVTATFPECKIDLFVKGTLAPILFKNYTNVEHIIHLPGKPFKDIIKYIKAWTALKKYKYDIAINVSKNSSSGRLSAQFANAKYQFSGDTVEELQQRYEDYSHIAKYSVYNFRHYLEKTGLVKMDSPVPTMNLKLSAAEIAGGKAILQDLVKNDNKTICIFTYATGAKIHSESWWAEFYGSLKADYPGYNIIEILPKENVSQIAFAAPTFYSNDVREIGAVIFNTAVFIGADSGIMHLASSVLTPTVGLFSITNPSIYYPYNANSVAIKTNDLTVAECVEVVHQILLPTTSL